MLKRVDHANSSAPGKLAQSSSEYYYYYSDTPVNEDYEVEALTLYVVLGAVGGALVVFLTVFLCVCCCKKSKQKEKQAKQDEKIASKIIFNQTNGTRKYPVSAGKQPVTQNDSNKTANQPMHSRTSQFTHAQFAHHGYPPHTQLPSQTYAPGPAQMYSQQNPGLNQIGFPGQPNIQQPAPFMSPNPYANVGMPVFHPNAGVTPGHGGHLYRPTGIEMPEYDGHKMHDPFGDNSGQNDDLPIFEVEINRK